MQSHRYAEIFPMMDDEAHAALVEDVRKNGITHPIIILDEQILDGRNRYKAAQILGIECPTKPFAGINPLDYVISANLHRRHLTTKQRAHIAAELATMKRGGDRKSEKIKPQNCGLILGAGMTAAEAAKLMNVSTRSVENAKQVMRDDPEAHEAAKAGRKPAKNPAENPAQQQEHHEMDALSGYIRIAQNAGLLNANTGSAKRKRLREQIDEYAPGAIEAKDGAAIRAACELIAKNKQGEAPEQSYENHRREVSATSETAKQKLERLVATEKAHLHAIFWAEVRAEAKRSAPEILRELEQRKDEYIKKNASMARLSAGIKPIITEAEYKLLLGLLHPDRAPEDRRERFARGFDIVRKLDSYIEAVKTIKAR